MKLKQFFFSLLFLSLSSASSFATSNVIDPERVSLIDTGYDACVQNKGVNCEANKNLLFRGAEPLPDDPPLVFNFENFRNNVFAALKEFKKQYKTDASLPANLTELKNYRIVVINLLYDYMENGSLSELAEVENEFKESGQTNILQIPEQHKMYGLDTPFSQQQFAFEWWPMTFATLDESDVNFVSMHMNWPDKNGTPEHSFEPQVYKPLNFPYLVSGVSYDKAEDKEAKDLRTLLTMIPKDGHPLLIFYHCLAGKDRTGAVSMGYFMKHGGYPFIALNNYKGQQIRKQPASLAQAFADTTIPEHPANIGAQRLAKAYCLYLNKSAEECRFS